MSILGPVDHLENTKGFSLRTIGEMVLDEADRMLSMDFEEELNRILDVIPRTGCRTSLFSATMTSKVQKLQRASLKNPVKVEVSTKFQTVKNLVQQYVFVPAKHKDCYGVSVVNDFAGKTGIIFCATHKSVMLFTLLLRNLGFSATCLHGGMTQPKRLGALNKFKAGARAILVATDVASRGLDIPSVDFVMNYDVPESGKDYVHRVGRTARAGRSGSAVTLVTQYDVEKYQRIEHLIEKKKELPVKSYHYKERLFDRDTLFVHQYKINFLFVLKAYTNFNTIKTEEFREVVKRDFRKHFIDFFNDSKSCDFEFYKCKLTTSKDYESIVSDNFKSLNGKCYVNMEAELILAKHIEDGIEESIMELFEPIRELK